MKTSLRIVILPVIMLVSVACSTKTVPSTNRRNIPSIPSDYDEDLSSVRPHYDEKPPIASATIPEKKIDKSTPSSKDIAVTVNAKVDAVLDTIANQNKSIKFAQGYRIQLYVGNNRQDVDNAKLYVMQSFPELNNYMSYNQPTYKLKVGDFMYRMDAERYFSTIRSQFSGATIVSDRIDIRKSLMAK